MSKIPPPSQTIVSKIYEALESCQSGKGRTHLGASIIGGECERKIWYTFRWAKAPKFSGRILRLFRSGKRAEDELADDLRSAGVMVHTVDPDTGEQFQFDDLGGHFAGSMDGCGQGFVEAPAAWHVIEFKTHNDKSFTDVEKNGVEKAKPDHYAQMQTYMGWSGMERSMYVALNKNTDQIYTERVEFDRVYFLRLKQKAREIIYGRGVPERINNSPAYYQCKWCQFAGICHEKGEIADVNCRTCVHSVPLEDGSWGCDKHNIILDRDTQEKACHDHDYREGMVPMQDAAAMKAFGQAIAEIAGTEGND